MRKMSQKSLDNLRLRAAHVLCVAIPQNTPEARLESLPDDIAHRIVENAKIVGSGKELRDQVLIVLADYRTHSWACGALVGEGTRIRLADEILGSYLGR